MTEVEFGGEPTSPPPDPNKPYLWVSGLNEWVLVATDTEDGVPETLDGLEQAGK